MKRTATVALTLLFATLFITAQAPKRSRRVPERKLDSPLDTVKLIYPKATAIQPINSVWNKAVDNKGNLLGYVFNSEVYGIDNLGYYEDVPVLVVTDKSEKIQYVSIINSYETPEYVEDIYRSGFMERWNGKKLTDIQSIEVDGVSGATLTSEAVIENMKLIANKALTTPVK
ncbi:MAG: FMN-binding protein [Phocaeicola sp.]